MKGYKGPLRLQPQPEGAKTVTSPALRGRVTEGDTLAEALRQEVMIIEIGYPVVRP